MLAFNNDQSLKDKYIAEICAKLIKDDENNFNYVDSETIPKWVIELNKKFTQTDKKFPLKLYQAINPGSNLNNIKAKFLIFVLEDVKQYYDNDKHKDVTKAINSVIELLYEDPELKNKERVKEATNAAYSAAYAAYAAYSAANSAAYAAYSAANSAYTANYAAYAAYAAYSAANSAAYAANYAAYSAYTANYAAYAAYSAADSANAANAANSAANSAANAANYAAYSAATQKHADKLIELLKEEK